MGRTGGIDHKVAHCIVQAGFLHVQTEALIHEVFKYLPN